MSRFPGVVEVTAPSPGDCSLSHWAVPHHRGSGPRLPLGGGVRGEGGWPSPCSRHLQLRHPEHSQLTAGERPAASPRGSRRMGSSTCWVFTALEGGWSPGLLARWPPRAPAIYPGPLPSLPPSSNSHTCLFWVKTGTSAWSPGKRIVTFYLLNDLPETTRRLPAWLPHPCPSVAITFIQHRIRRPCS